MTLDNGIRIKDDLDVARTESYGRFTTDHISPENLALFFLGSASVLTQAAATQTYNIADAKKNRRYQIGQTAPSRRPACAASPTWS